MSGHGHVKIRAVSGQGKARSSRQSHGKVKASQGKVRARSKQDQSKVKVTSKQSKTKDKASSRQCKGKVKTRSKQGQGKVKVKSRQGKHNLNCNYNMMGFDSIEITLVFASLFHFNLMNYWSCFYNLPPVKVLWKIFILSNTTLYVLYFTKQIVLAKSDQ